MRRRLVLLMAVLVVASSMAMAQEWIQNPAGYMEISI